MRDDVFAPPLDRGEFPILQRLVGRDGARPLVYLDSAATALVPERVIGAVERFLRTSCANIHRGAHLLAEEATDAYEGAREHLASFFGVDDPARVLLVQNATDACNLAAFGWGARVLGPGDVVAVAEDNHHANIVCWQMLAERHGVEVAWIPSMRTVVSISKRGASWPSGPQASSRSRRSRTCSGSRSPT